jgi:hypothetical protein
MAAVDSPSLADAREDAGAQGGADAGPGDAGPADGPVADAPGTAGPGACDAGTVQFEVRSGGGPWWVCGSGDAPNAPGPNDFTVFTTAGAQLDLAPFGAWDCQSCAWMYPIPIGFWCATLDDGGAGTMSVDAPKWDGTYYAQQSCGANAVQCVTKACAPPGTYEAKVCACPHADWQAGPTCTQFTCLDVPFTYPSSTPIDVVLPAQ